MGFSAYDHLHRSQTLAVRPRGYLSADRNGATLATSRRLERRELTAGTSHSISVNDGRRISALFDTGAQFSVLSTRTALALGVSEGVLARDPAVMVRGADGEQLSAHAHRFFRLEVDGEVIRNAEIDVTEINLNDADFVLGIDFLGSQRVWISYGSQQLFLMRRI